MSWKSIVRELNGTWTKTLWPAKNGLLHICCCGYAGVFPQQRRFLRRFCCLNLSVLHKTVCQQELGFVPGGGPGASTFFLKTSKRSSSVGDRLGRSRDGEILLRGRFANAVLWKTVASSSFCRQAVSSCPVLAFPSVLPSFSPVFHAKRLLCIS
jgi:hypothetical protein